MATTRGFSAVVSCQHSLVTATGCAELKMCCYTKQVFLRSMLRHVCVRHCCDHYCWVVSQARIVAMRWKQFQAGDFLKKLAAKSKLTL